MRKLTLFLGCLIGIICLLTFPGCSKDEQCPEHKGVFLGPYVCGGDRSILIEVKSKQIGRSFTYKNKEIENVIAVAIDSISASGEIYVAMESFKIGDTIYFDFVEQQIETPHCTALFAIPAIRGKITQFSKTKCIESQT
jgi:hypothetical protein